MPELNKKNLKYFLYGSRLLASGGEESEIVSIQAMKMVFDNSKTINIIGYEEDTTDKKKIIVFLSVIGSEGISGEKPLNILNFDILLKKVKHQFNCSFFISPMLTVSSSIVIFFASVYGYRIADCDMAGRAVPSIEMFSPNVHGIAPEAFYIIDSFGNIIELHVKDYDKIERYARAICVELGSLCLCAMVFVVDTSLPCPFIKGSMAKAIEIGKIVHSAFPGQFLHPLLDYIKGEYVGYGTVVDIDLKIENALIHGFISVQGVNDLWTIIVQNEFLFVECRGKTLASTPDIIALLDENTGEPLASNSVFFGEKVFIIKAPADPIWYTKKGLSLVGPEVYYKKKEEKDRKFRFIGSKITNANFRY